jgi:putative DNA primase/helicase
MSIEALILRKLHQRAEQRTSKTGRPFVTAKARAAAGDGELLFVNVIAFGKTACAALLALDAGDSLALAGTLKPGAWTDREGNARPSLDVVATQVLTVYGLKKKREPAAASHAYIEAKQGTPEGLRVVPDSDPLRVNGESVAGWLVVPVVPLAGGEPASLQFIPPPGAGKKLNLPGAQVAGVFIVGDMLAGDTAFLCEGIGQAWACWKATGAAAVVCFGWGRVRSVAAELRQRDASARLVLVPDVGKEVEAATIARKLAAQFVTMPEGWPLNSDANDLARRDGFDALEALLSAPQTPAQRFRLLGSADLHALPPLTWRVRGVLPAQGLASLYGASASGKSFLVLDMAAAIAEGRDWFGYQVRACPVVLVCLEGAAGFRLRVEAWERHHGRALPAGLRLVLQPFKLTEPQDVQDMAAAVLSAGAGAVTFVDTLNASAPGIDENASRDMGIVLEAAKTLQALTGGLVAAVHHSGKDATKGLRGHSSLFAALDAAVEVSRDGDRREWKLAKAKDGADGEAHPFHLEVEDLAPDADGESVRSCVVRRDLAAADIARVKLPQGGNQKLVLENLRPLLKASQSIGMAGAPPLRPCFELEAAITATATRLTCATDRRAERAREAIRGLVTRGVLGCNEGWLWLM